MISFILLMIRHFLFFCLIACLSLFAWLLLTSFHTNVKYEYTDLDNNTGIAARYCNNKSNLVCYLKDGTIIQVKSFKRIEVRK